MPFRTPGTTNGGTIDPGTSARQQMTAPVTTGLSSDPTGISRLLRKARCVRRAFNESDGPAARIFVQETSYDFGEIGKMIFEGIAAASLGLLATTGLGAALGAAVGALGFGAGAIPGAAIGAKLGLDAGLVLLNVLGLGFLAFYVGYRLGEVIEHYRAGVALAWDAGDHDSPPLRDAAVARAAEEIGRGKALLLRLILEGIVAAILHRGLGYVTGQLSKSKFGKDFALWIEKNAERLKNDPKLSAPPKASAPETVSPSSAQTPSALNKTAAGSSGAAKPQAAKPSSSSGGAAAKPPYRYDLRPGVDTGQPIKFGQQGVSPNFSKGGGMKNADLDDVVRKLKSGEMSPDELPVKYIWVNGEKVAVNNRSLTALSKAGMQPTKTTDMTGRLPTSPREPDALPNVLGRLDEMGGKPSTSMPVRLENRRDSPIREIVTLPD